LADDVEHVTVAVVGDFVEKQTRSKPIPALAELIWNALDADATRVTVELVHRDLAGGLSKIVVTDNGTGLSREEAPELFRNLGGSWKRMQHRTAKGQRSVHGRDGKGRFKAFALGRAVTWQVVSGARPEDQRRFTVQITGSDLTDVSISAAEPAPTAPRGVAVVIEDVEKDFRVFETDEGLQDLAEIFAVYLTNYKDVVIEVAGRRVDPEAVIAGRHEERLTRTATSDGQEHPFDLMIIEWKADTKRTLYLCSEDWFPLDQVETRLHAPGHSFSAYLRSAYITELNDDGRLGLAELDGQLATVLEDAKEAIKAWLRTRAAEQAQTYVDQWKAEKVYPYVGDPQTSVEKAERQVFEIVASQVQHFAPEVAATTRSTRVHLRLLRAAIESGPEELQTILREVLDLPASKQRDLAVLLQETSLSAIIAAAKTVADRLKFIDALEQIVFDPEMKARLKERTQLHKILAENTWVFGEEFHLWASDKGLRAVLEKHRDKLAPDIDIEDPVRVYNQKTAIVDLMLSRSTRRHTADSIEHLVVELKAPKVVIGPAETTQIKKYHQAVIGDERFNTVPGLRWHFIVVSNAYDDLTRIDLESIDREKRLIVNTPRSTVAVRTWGEIIEDNKARLQFFQESLQHSATSEQALAYLQERHAALLKGVIEEPAAEEEVLQPATSPTA
jgi:hypothetical protein